MKKFFSLFILTLSFLPAAAAARSIADLCNVPDPWEDCVNNVCPDTYDYLSYPVYRGVYPTCPATMAVRDVVCITSLPYSCRWQCLPTENKNSVWHAAFLSSTFAQDLSGVGER